MAVDENNQDAESSHESDDDVVEKREQLKISLRDVDLIFPVSDNFTEVQERLVLQNSISSSDYELCRTNQEMQRRWKPVEDCQSLNTN